MYDTYIYIYTCIYTHYTHLCCSLTVHRSRQDLTLDRLKVVPPSAPWEKNVGSTISTADETWFEYMKTLIIDNCYYTLVLQIPSEKM